MYTFLEKDVIFFSENIELLSLTINTYQNLNFPLNDQTYYYINTSVSYENYKRGNSNFVGSVFTSMIGINDRYRDNYMSECTHKIKEHLAIDLDSGKIYQVQDPDDKASTDKNILFFDFVKRICKGREENGQTILERGFKSLNNELNKCLDTLSNNRDCRDKKLLDYNKTIHEINLRIQECFYRFINIVSIYFYKKLKIKISTASSKDSPISTEILFDRYATKDFNEEEKYFIDEFKDTTKFQSFIIGFVQSYKSIDLYKIPLTFTEEFVSILSRKSNIQLKNIKFFSFFDNLFQIKQRGRIDVDFHPFMFKYFVDYKKIFDRDIQEYYNIEKKSKSKFNLSKLMKGKELFNFNYIWYELDNMIILKYLDLLKNMNKEEYTNLFHFQLLNLKNNNIKEVLVSDIENNVENYAFESRLLSKKDICGGNILLLSTLTLKFFKSNLVIQSFLSTLFNDYTIFRKYYTIILNMIYKLMEESIKNKDYSQAQNLLLFYYPCINSINNIGLIPNENLMNIIKKFNSIDINNLTEKVKKYSAEEKNNNYDDISIENNLKKINENNLYVCYNFTHDGIISEKEILKEINENKEFKNKFKNRKTPIIKYRMGKIMIESEIYSQKKILEMLTKEYNSFNEHLDSNAINSKIILDAAMNIYIFTRNIINYESEIFDILRVIFFIYLDKYLLGKQEKEKTGT
jgi:hypothetical protein